MIGIVLLYFVFAGASYYLIFDKRMMRHPRFLKNQVTAGDHVQYVGVPVDDTFDDAVVHGRGEGVLADVLGCGEVWVDVFLLYDTLVSPSLPPFSPCHSKNYLSLPALCFSK